MKARKSCVGTVEALRYPDVEVMIRLRTGGQLYGLLVRALSEDGCAVRPWGRLDVWELDPEIIASAIVSDVTSWQDVTRISREQRAMMMPPEPEPVEIPDDLYADLAETDVDEHGTLDAYARGCADAAVMGQPLPPEPDNAAEDDES